MSMLAPWPLTTLSGTNPAFMERDEPQIILGCMPLWLKRKGSILQSPHWLPPHQWGENNLRQTEWEGAGFVRQKWNNLVFIKYHEKSIHSCQKHKYKHYHVESIYSEETIWQSREDLSVH